MAAPIGDNVVVIANDDDFLTAGYCIPERLPQVLLPTAVRTPGGDISRPIQGRQVIDWDQLETLYAHAFYKQLGWIVGDEGAVLMCEPMMTSRADRERHCQTMFESFNVSGYYVAEAPVLSLYGMGKTAGFSVDVGYSVTDVAPVIDGAVAHAASRRIEIGSRDVTDALVDCLHEKHQQLSEAELNAVRDAVGFVAPSSKAFNDDTHTASSSYTLPDGNEIAVGGNVRMKCVEQLITGTRDSNHGGVSDALLASVSACTAEQRLACLDAIAVSGGWAGGPGARAGFEQRVVKDLEDSLPPSARPVPAGTPEHMPPDASRYASWFGGALLGKIVFAQNHHVSKFEYQENGPGIVTKAGR